MDAADGSECDLQSRCFIVIGSGWTQRRRAESVKALMHLVADQATRCGADLSDSGNGHEPLPLAIGNQVFGTVRDLSFPVHTRKIQFLANWVLPVIQSGGSLLAYRNNVGMSASLPGLGFRQRRRIQLQGILRTNQASARWCAHTAQRFKAMLLSRPDANSSETVEVASEGCTHLCPARMRMFS